MPKWDFYHESRFPSLNEIKKITIFCKLGNVTEIGIVWELLDDDIMSKKSKLLEYVVLVVALLFKELRLEFVAKLLDELSSNDKSWSIVLAWDEGVGLILLTGKGWMLWIKYFELKIKTIFAFL